MAYPEGPAVYLGEEWLELVRFAASEASRLSLEFGFHNSAGWANYTTEFKLDRRHLSPDVSLDRYVEEGINLLEVDVTNLWPNRLIGDDSLPEDYEMNGNRISKWPDWLGSDVARESGRTTFTTWKHWSKTDELLPSGLCGPVVIRSYAKVKLK